MVLRSAIKKVFQLNISVTPPIAVLMAGSLWLAWSSDDWYGNEAIAVALWAAAFAAILVDLIGGASRIQKGEAWPIRPTARQRLAFWLPVAVLLVSAAALFIADHAALAVVVQTHLSGRLFGGLMQVVNPPVRLGDQMGVVEELPPRRLQINRLEIGTAAYVAALSAGLLWMVFGNPPGWLHDMTVAAWWLSLLTVTGAMALGFYHHVEAPLSVGILNRLLREPAASAKAEAGVLTPYITGRVGMAYSLLTCLALIGGDQIALACLLVLLMMILRAEAVQKKLMEAGGGKARIDTLSRVLHGLMVNAVSLLVSPVRCVNTLLETGPTREVAVLREAFGRPGGFIYFLCEQPQQRAAFLEEGGLLEWFAEHVVERKWHGDMFTAVDSANSDAQLVAAERDMLARYKIHPADTRKNFILIVPPKGYATEFRFGDTSAARIGGDSMQTLGVQYRFLCAAAKAFGPPAE